MASRVELTPLMGALSDGPLCYLLRINKFRILLDCGWNESFDLSLLEPLRDVASSIHAVLLSHADISHVGAFPYACAKLGLTAPAYCTVPVHKLGTLEMYSQFLNRQQVSNFDLFTLDDVDKAFENTIRLKFSQPQALGLESDSIVITPYNAGHSLGGTIWRICLDSEDIVYAVDFNHRPERHLSACQLASLPRPAVLITGARDSFRPDAKKRKQQEEEVVMAVEAALRRGGNVLLPVEAVGRVLELLLLFEEHWRSRSLPFPIALLSHVSSNLLEFAHGNLEWMNDSAARSFESDRLNPFDLKHVTLCHSLDDLSLLPPGPRLVLAPSPSLEQGPARELALSWASHPPNLILLTHLHATSSPLSLPFSFPLQNLMPPSSGGGIQGTTLAERLLQLASKGPCLLDVEISTKVPLVGEELAAFEEAKRREEEERRREMEGLGGSNAPVADDERRGEADGDVDMGDPAEGGTEVEQGESGLGSMLTSVAADGVDGGGGGGGSGGGDDGRGSKGLEGGGKGTAGSEMEGDPKDKEISAEGGGRWYEFPDEADPSTTHRVLLEGFSPPPSLLPLVSSPSFPPPVEPSRWDEYGEMTNPNEFRASHGNVEVGEGEGGGQQQLSTPQPNAAEVAAMEEDLEVLALLERPAKILTSVSRIRVACQVKHIDFEGLSDGRSIKALLTRVNPRKLVLIHGSQEATAHLLSYYQMGHQQQQGEDRGEDSPVAVAPAVGETVNLSAELATLKLHLSDDLLASMKFRQLGNYELSWVDGLLAQPHLSSSTSYTSPFLLLPPSAVEGRVVRPRHPRRSVLVGDVKLSDVKEKLQAAGLQAEFAALGNSKGRGPPTLLCYSPSSQLPPTDPAQPQGPQPQPVAVRKVDSRRIVVEGVISKDFFRIRDLVLSQFASF